MGKVVQGLTILWYPRGLRNEGLITPKNVNSACIRTVFKIQSRNFARSNPGQVVIGLKILGVPALGRLTFQVGRAEGGWGWRVEGIHLYDILML